jgi:hypothetical protein
VAVACVAVVAGLQSPRCRCLCLEQLPWRVDRRDLFIVLRDTQLLRALDLIVGLRKAVDLLAMVRHRNLK